MVSRRASRARGYLKDMIFASLAAALLAANASALTLPDFSAALASVRQSVRETRQAQVENRAADLSNDIRSLGWDVDRERRTVSQFRFRIQDAARRARQQAGQPKPDPFLRSEVQRLVWDLQGSARQLDYALRDLQRIRREAVKDPALVSPARQLESSVQWLQSDANWIEMDARNASWDLRRAGFSMEAWDVERGGSDITRTARDLQSEARELLNKVQ